MVYVSGDSKKISWDIGYRTIGCRSEEPQTGTVTCTEYPVSSPKTQAKKSL